MAFDVHQPISEYLRDNPSATWDDIMKNLEDEGYSISRNKKTSWAGKVQKSFEEIDRALTGITKHWMAVDESAAKFARSVGLAEEGLNRLRKDAIHNVIKYNIGFDFGMNSKDLLEASQKYVTTVGRNIRISDEDTQRSLAAITSVYAESSEFLNDFEKFGLSISSAGEHMGRMYATAGKNGLSLERYAKNVQQGLAIAQTYTFRGGLKGMEEMAKRATAIRMEMSQVQSFAESFSTIEKAIENSAKLQVLGGPFSTGADALGLLNDSLNGIEDAEKRMEKFTEGIGRFNKTTGEVEVSQFNKMRLKAYAEATGQDYAKVMEVTQRQAMRGEIDKQIAASTNASGFDDELKELIRNSATFKNGKAGVSINGKFRTLDELREKDREDLINEAKTDSENIQDIAKNVRSLTERRTGVQKQFESVAAHIEAPFGQVMKLGTRIFASLGMVGSAILGVVAGFRIFAYGSESLARLKNIWAKAPSTGGGTSGGANSAIRRGGGSSGGANSAIRRGATRPTRVARAAKVPSGGKQIISAAGKQYTQVGTRVFNSTGTEIFGAAKTAATNGATAAGKASIARRGAGRAIQRTAIKIGGKTGGRLISGVGTGLAKGGAIGLIGALGDIGTDMLVESGKVKEGGAAHATMKIGSKAAAGYGTGALIGGILGSVVPVIGNAAGAAVGGAVGAAVGALSGAMKIDKINNGKIVDAQLKSLGIERKGDYGAGKLNEIDKALQTGKMSNALRKKLLKEGDADIVNQINSIKAEKKKAKDEERKQKRQNIRENIGTANITVGQGYFNGTGFNSLGLVGVGLNSLKAGMGALGQGIKVLRGKKEDGNSQELQAFKKAVEAKRNESRREDNQAANNGKLEVNFTGEIKLESANGESIDLLKEIRGNQRLMNQLTEMIIEKMNERKRGGVYTEGRSNGDNFN